MDYLFYTALVAGIVLFVYGMLKSAEKKREEAMLHDEKAVETPELAPDIYAGALAYLLIDAELRGLQLAQRRGDDEAGKGARV